MHLLKDQRFLQGGERVWVRESVFVETFEEDRTVCKRQIDKKKNDRDIFGTANILAGLQECHIWISERREGNKAGNIGKNYL